MRKMVEVEEDGRWKAEGMYDTYVRARARAISVGGW